VEITIEQAMEVGVAASNRGNVQEAERIFRAILQSQPGHGYANFHLGLIAVSVGQFSEARPFLEAALKSNDNVEQFWLSYIENLIKEHDFTSAERFIKKAIKKGILKDKINSLKNQIKVEKKLQVKGDKLQDPSEMRLNKLISLYSRGQFDIARDLAISLTKESPDHQLAWNILGAIFGQSGQNNDALIAFQNATRLGPNDALAHMNLASLLADMGRLQEAEDYFKRVIVLDPNFSEAYFRLGLILLNSNRETDAEDFFTKVILLEPNNAKAFCNLAKAMQKRGAIEDAEANYRHAIALNPALSEASYNYACLLQQLHRVSEAEKFYRKAIENDPNLYVAVNNLAALLHKTGQTLEAEKLYRKLIEFECHHEGSLFPLPNAGNLNLGLLLKSEKRYTEAIYHLELVEGEVSMLNQALCNFELGDYVTFDKNLVSLEKLGVLNSQMGSLVTRGNVRFNQRRENLFCEKPLSYVLHADLRKFCDFENLIRNEAVAILNDNKVPYRKQSLLSNGRQTYGNLFDMESVALTKIEDIIRDKVDEYAAVFMNSADGFISKWPTEYSIYGWLIGIKCGGKLSPHMHEGGWLSGSIYINVPADSVDNSGCLVVCLDDDISMVDKGASEGEGGKKIVDVYTGSLVLFPSSLLHYTIPFESDEERIVLAFDVVPKEKSYTIDS
tara:strand:+ start:276 stop:2294 length:2019 start_codon:yes stop_codon:yes gene_type:complete